MHLSSLYRFPLKSAAGESLQRCASDLLGLLGDRRWMVVAAGTGRFLTQRVLPRMALLQAHWQGDTALKLAAPGMPELLVRVPDDKTMRCVQVWSANPVVPDAGETAAAWLSDFLGQACRLVYLPEDDGIQVDLDYARLGERTAFSDGFPFLLIGQASLDDLAPTCRASTGDAALSTEPCRQRGRALCRGWLEAHPYRPADLPCGQALFALRHPHARPGHWRARARSGATEYAAVVSQRAGRGVLRPESDRRRARRAGSRNAGRAAGVRNGRPGRCAVRAGCASLRFEITLVPLHQRLG